MRYQADQRITLGKTSYQIVRPLGNGALAEVYEVLADGTTHPAVLKILREDRRPGGDEAEGLHHEAQVLRRLNLAEDPQSGHVLRVGDRIRYATETEAQRQVVMLFDEGEAEPGVPFLIQELAPAEFEASDVQTLDDEHQILAVMHAVSQVMVLAHKHDLALKDFDPRTKYDRIRVRWLDGSDRFEFKVIDWNVTGGPEDWADDLFLFGGHLYHLLLGRYLALGADGRPPANLGMGIPAWGQISEGSRQILGRLLHRSPERRYQRAARVEADLAWLLRVMDLARDLSTLKRLPDQAWSAKTQGRHDRVLTVADLVLRQDPAASTRQMLETMQREAREKLKGELWHPIVDCESSLMAGLFSQAMACFDRVQLNLDPRSEAARQVRLMRIQAATGHALKESGLSDVLESREWANVVQAVNAIKEQQWELAERRIQDVLEVHPGQSILNQARAGKLYSEAMTLINQAKEHPTDASRDDWRAIYTGKLDLLRQATGKLEAAVRLVPDEILFEDALVQVQAKIQEREQLLGHYEEVDKYHTEAEEILSRPDVERYDKAIQPLRQAIEVLRRVLEIDDQQFRAQVLLDRMTYRLNFAEAMAQVQRSLVDGRYVEAEKYVAESQHVFRQEHSAQSLATEVVAGASLERRAREWLDTATSTLQVGNFEQAAKLAGRVVAMQEKPLVELDIGISVSLSEAIGLRPFRLRGDLEKRAQKVEEQATFFQETDLRLDEAWQQGEYTTIITLLTDLEKRYGELSSRHQRILDKAHERLRRLERASQMLGSASSFEELVAGLDEIAPGDPSPRAEVLRSQAADQWRSLARKAEDLEEALRRVDEGQERFAELSPAPRWDHERGIMNLALEVERELPLSEGLTDNELRDRLMRLDEALSCLLKPESWSVVQKRAFAWRDEVVSFLARLLKARRNEAQQDVDDKRFSEAERKTTQAKDLVPERLWQRLPADVRDGLETLERDAGAVVELRESWGRLLQQLEAGELSFARAADELPDLPRGIELPLEAAWFKEVRQAGQKEEAHHLRPTLRSYAQVIHERQEALELPRVVTESRYSSRAPETIRRLMALEKKLGRSVNDLANELLETKIQQERERLVERPEASPDDLLILYWQVRWLRVALPEKKREAEEKLQGVVEVARALARKLRDTVVEMEGKGSLETALAMLSTLQRLNEGLATMPTMEGQPLLELPPLPPDTTDDYRPQDLDAGALRQIQEDVESLLALAGRAVGRPDETELEETEQEASALPEEADSESLAESSETPEPKPPGGLITAFRKLLGRQEMEQPGESDTSLPDPAVPAARPRLLPAVSLADIQSVTEIAARVERRLASLKDAFGKLDLEFSGPSLGGLQAELSRLKESARLLEGVEQHREKHEADQLQEKLGDFYLVFGQLDERWRWLLGPEQMTLRTAARASDSRLDADLQNQVSEILQDERTVAKEKIREFIVSGRTGRMGQRDAVASSDEQEKDVAGSTETEQAAVGAESPRLEPKDAQQLPPPGAEGRARRGETQAPDDRDRGETPATPEVGAGWGVEEKER